MKRIAVLAVLAVALFVIPTLGTLFADPHEFAGGTFYNVKEYDFNVVFQGIQLAAFEFTTIGGGFYDNVDGAMRKMSGSFGPNHVMQAYSEGDYLLRDIYWQTTRSRLNTETGYNGSVLGFDLYIPGAASGPNRTYFEQVATFGENFFTGVDVRNTGGWTTGSTTRDVGYWAAHNDGYFRTNSVSPIGGAHPGWGDFSAQLFAQEGFTQTSFVHEWKGQEPVHSALFSGTGDAFWSVDIPSRTFDGWAQWGTPPDNDD